MPKNLKILNLSNLEKIGEWVKFPEKLEELRLKSRHVLPDDFQIPKTLKSLIISGKKVSVNQLKIYLWNRKIKAKINKLFSK